MTNANEFAALHTSAEPLVLFNVWDAGSARAVAGTGAKAIATGSLSLAGAQGFADGEDIPFDALLVTVRQIADAIDLPLTVDFETGYAADLASLARNSRALQDAGAVGCNLEDGLIGSDGLRPAAEQAARIEAAAKAGLFVNGRTDLFLNPLMSGEDPNRRELVDRAIARAEAYRDAGAGCFFVPGLSAPELIEDLCAAVAMPVNVMRLDGMPTNAELGRLGVARISHGPGPWRDAMTTLAQAAQAALDG